MPYATDLGMGQRLWIDNRDRLTTVALSSSRAGQQQSQQMSVETGAWSAPPQVFRTGEGFVVQVQTAAGPRYVQVQGNQMQVLNGVPLLTGTEVLPLEEVAESPMQPMQPMRPMEPMKPMPPMHSGEPMKMGDMEMSLNPMQMKMGNMELRMGASTGAQPQQRFCSQCGSAVQLSDRFCAHCGHRLGELSHG